MIVVTKGDKKIVLIISEDKSTGKYRSVNIGERTIAPQQYESPDQIIGILKRSLQEGRIDKLTITEEII